MKRLVDTPTLFTRVRRGGVLFIALFILGVAPLTSLSVANADSTTDGFNPGNIISNAVFYNTDTMSEASIQSFLNSQMTNCNTNAPGYTGGTGTVYNPPWVCLNNFYENPNSTYTVSFTYTDTSGATQTGTRVYYANNDYRYTSLTPVYNNGNPADGIDYLTATIQSMNGVIPAGAISAAQIIYNAAQEYGINPQVLIVLLQKEQGLVTNSSPAPWEYQQATGYGCPDYSPCSAGYSGFSKQVISAAWQFQQYELNPSTYPFLPNANNSVAYNPDSSCGSSSVYIQNVATASLYDYTPYQPDTAALAAGYGTGDSCSSYGNRNFWLYFNSWFGSTQGISPQTDAIWRLYNPITGDHLLTASASTAIIYMTYGWKSDGVIAHTAITGGTPVYQLWNGEYHFYTDNTATLNAYLADGWSNNGPVFNEPSTGLPVYQLWNGISHFYTSSVQELQVYMNAGWRDDGIAFYQPTNEIDPVWRLYNHNNGDHYLTDNPSVMNVYLAAGWTSDGIVTRGTEPSDGGIPVYQLWNGEYHFYTDSSFIRSVYINAGWQGDGIAFYTATSGTPVYQLWNGISHFYTASKNELEVYLAAGWRSDGIAFYTSNEIGISRFYNPTTGAHTLATTNSQIWQLLANGWSDDGVLFNDSTSDGTPVYQLFNTITGSYFYSASTSEVTTYMNSGGWENKGIVFYAPTQDVPLYRLYNPTNQTHVIALSSEVANYINAGWISNGIVFYGM